MTEPGLVVKPVSCAGDLTISVSALLGFVLEMTEQQVSLKTDFQAIHPL